MENLTITRTSSGGILVAHIAKFHEGVLCFEHLVQLYPKHTFAELGEVLGFQFPKNIVSVRHVNDSEWPFEDIEAIREARQKYDQGTHEMATGREFNHFVLYLFPRRVPRKESLNYFHTLSGLHG